MCTLSAETDDDLVKIALDICWIKNLFFYPFITYVRQGLMIESLTSILKVKSLVDSSVTLKLLRAGNLPLIASFLYREYKMGQQISIPYQYLIQKLEDCLEEIQCQAEVGEIEGGGSNLAFDEKAKRYTDRWIDARYLRNMMDEERKEPLVFLSQHVEKVFQVFEILKNRDFVGAESKFKGCYSATA